MIKKSIRIRPDLPLRQDTWPSNIWGMYERVFGPLEVNLEAYSTFEGNERIIVVTQQNFRQLPLRTCERIGATFKQAHSPPP